MPTAQSRFLATAFSLFRRRGKPVQAENSSSKSALAAPPSPSSTCLASNCSDISEDSSSWSHDEEDDQTVLAAPSFLEDAEAHLCWTKALAGRHVTEMPSEELHALVSSASPVPLKYRILLWPLWFANGAHALTEQRDHLQMSESRLSELEALASCEALRLIDLDVPRTMPHVLGSQDRLSLRRVLRAFAGLMPDIGYCQGLNNIAASFLTLGFDERTTLAGIHGLLTRCCPNYHTPGLAGFRSDAALLNSLMRNVLDADALSRFEALNVPLEALAAQHFLALSSCNDWPLSATAQLWDNLLLNGQPALFASFVAMLKLYLPPVIADADDGSQELSPVEIFRLRCRFGLHEESKVYFELLNDLLPTVVEALTSAR